MPKKIDLVRDTTAQQMIDAVTAQTEAIRSWTEQISQQVSDINRLRKEVASLRTDVQDLTKLDNQVNKLIIDKEVASRLQPLERAHGLVDIENSDWDKIRDVVSKGWASYYYPIGSKLVQQYKWDNANYPASHIITHLGNIYDNDDIVRPGMFLEWEWSPLPEIPFASEQAILRLKRGLAEGSYAIYVRTLPDAWTSVRSKFIGKHLCFNVSTYIPEGSVIRGVNIGNDSSNWGVKITSDESLSASILDSSLFTVSSNLPAGCDILGETGGNDIGYGKVNNLGRVVGTNNWKDSAIRKWLNSHTSAWWSPSNEYDLEPASATLPGFLSGYSESFLKKIKPVRVETFNNTVDGSEEKSVTYDRVFLHSMREIYASSFDSKQSNNQDEGYQWDYYKQLAGTVSSASVKSEDGRFKMNFGGSGCSALKRTDLSNTARIIYSRSAVLDNTTSVYCVNTAGSMVSTGAAVYTSRRGCVPAFVLY